MMQTIEAVIDENGRVRLLENVRLPRACRALLTILDDEPKQIKNGIWASDHELSDALDTAYADDTDEEENEFLRAASVRQTEILDEWK